MGAHKIGDVLADQLEPSRLITSVNFRSLVRSGRRIIISQLCLINFSQLPLTDVSQLSLDQSTLALVRSGGVEDQSTPPGTYQSTISLSLCLSFAVEISQLSLLFAVGASKIGDALADQLEPRVGKGAQIDSFKTSLPRP